jgi:hypothetical protein
MAAAGGAGRCDHVSLHVAALLGRQAHQHLAPQQQKLPEHFGIPQAVAACCQGGCCTVTDECGLADSCCFCCCWCRGTPGTTRQRRRLL